MDRARQRIAWALGASVLLHMGFIQTAQQPGAPRVTVVSGAPLTATLSRPRIDAVAQETAPRNAPAPERVDTSNAISKNDVAAERAVTVAVVERPAQPPTAADNAAVLTPTPTLPPSDPTYYAARDLDVFPKAITVLDLGLRARAAGTVRATLLIDESGTVNEVRAVDAIDAGGAEIENAARELLLRARFTPARKDGRQVKAELLVSLNYGQSR
jgi:hypothetical protein